MENRSFTLSGLSAIFKPQSVKSYQLTEIQLKFVLWRHLTTNSKRTMRVCHQTLILPCGLCCFIQNLLRNRTVVSRRKHDLIVIVCRQTLQFAVYPCTEWWKRNKIRYQRPATSTWRRNPAPCQNNENGGTSIEGPYYWFSPSCDVVFAPIFVFMCFKNGQIMFNFFFFLL